MLSVFKAGFDALLELLINKGVVALNIVPDRNWNISDPETRALPTLLLGAYGLSASFAPTRPSTDLGYPKPMSRIFASLRLAVRSLLRAPILRSPTTQCSPTCCRTLDRCRRRRG